VTNLSATAPPPHRDRRSIRGDRRLTPHRPPRWGVVVSGYLVALAFGAGYSAFIKSFGDWNSGAHWERALMLAIHAHTLPDSVAYAVDAAPWIGTNLTLFPVAAALSLWFWRRGRLDLAVWLMVAELGCLTHNYFLKHLFERDRPNLFERVGWYGWGSYPSGHAMASIAVLGTIALMLLRERGWRWPLVVVLVVALVNAYGRIYHGVHWPSDVLAGGVVGLLWLLFTAIAFDGLPRRRSGDKPRAKSLWSTRRAG
jgi:membrane-associated phospholipid phosphatase